MRRKNLEIHRGKAVSEAVGTVLEIGFGSGLNLPYYKNITKLYALEPSLEMYKLARERIEKSGFPITHLEASAEHIPLGDNTVDSIVSTWSLCSIPHPEITLKEMYRALKPGGTYAFAEHGKSPSVIMSKIQDILTPFSKRFMRGCHLNRDIEKMIVKAGFILEKMETSSSVSKPLAFMYVGVARK